MVVVVVVVRGIVVVWSWSSWQGVVVVVVDGRSSWSWVVVSSSRLRGIVVVVVGDSVGLSCAEVAVALATITTALSAMTRVAPRPNQWITT